MAPWALAEKGPEVRLNGFGSNRFRGDRLMCGGPAPYASSAMRPTAHTQQASSRAVATFALLLWTPRASSASRLSTSLRTPLAWIGNIYLDDSGRDSPASLNSTGDM